MSYAVATVSAVEPSCVLDRIDVADFRSRLLEGLWKNGRLVLAKRILADKDSALTVLVHETAHDKGVDGEHAHVHQIERIWSGIVRNTRDVVA